MKFIEALELMKQGYTVKMPNWAGFWKLENGNIMMHCKNGEVLDIRQTNDILYTLGFILSDEWVLAGESNCPVLLGEVVRTFNFGEALRNIKVGKKVARSGWNGKSQYIELATRISYANTNGDIVNAEHDAIGNKAIAFVGTSGVQLGWLASQADMLADDWKVVE